MFVVIPRCGYSSSQGAMTSSDTVVPALRSEELRETMGPGVPLPSLGCSYHFISFMLWPLLSLSRGGKYDEEEKKHNPDCP